MERKTLFYVSNKQWKTAGVLTIYNKDYSEIKLNNDACGLSYFILSWACKIMQDYGLNINVDKDIPLEKELKLSDCLFNEDIFIYLTSNWKIKVYYDDRYRLDKDSKSTITLMYLDGTSEFGLK